MKKLFILLTALTVCAFANAKDDLLIVEEGSPEFWTETGKLATVSIDWSNTVVVEWDNKGKVKNNFGTIEQYNRSKGEDFVRDWPNVQQVVENQAASWANYVNKKKGLKVISPMSPMMFEAMKNMDEKQKKELTKDWSKLEKKGTLYRDYSEAAYDIFFAIDTIDMGNAGASVFRTAFGEAQYNGGAEIVGTMEVRDHATQNIVCKMHMNHVKGLGTYSETARMYNVFWRLWQDALPTLIKSLSKKKK